MKTDRRLFGLLVFLQTAVTAWLLLDHRMVKTHDTLSIYQLQYFFHAHAAAGGDPALWLPYSVHGVITNWYACFQGGLLQNILLLFGGLPEGTNLIPFFYAGMFLDEFILLLGVWHLGRRLYSSPWTRFFVAAAVIGSSFWASQIHFNLKNFYAIPLVLSLVHDFLEDGRRSSLVLAAALAALQFTGNIMYMSVLTLLVVLAYLVLHAAFFPRVWAARLRSLRPADALAVVVGGALLAAIYAGLSDGASSLRLFRTGRNPDGTVTLDSFLTYATTLNPTRYLDFVLGISPSMDYTLYCGLAVPAFAFLALAARPGRPVLHLAVCVLLLLLFSTGYLSLVGAVAYEAVPPLRYFRYVGMTGPIVKLFLILLSGYGVDALATGRLGLFRRYSAVAAAGSAGVALLALLCGISPAWRTLVGDVLRAGSADVANRPAVLGAFPTATLAGTGLAAAALAALLLFGRRMATGRMVVLLLVLQTADVFRWKVQMLADETVRLDAAQTALHEVRPLPYLGRRLGYESSARHRTLEPVFFDYGARYDLADGFADVDPPASRYSIGYWLAPFEAIVQAHDRKPQDARIARRAVFPARIADPYAKVIGSAEDKLQVFRRAHVAASDQALADLMNSPAFKGDVLLLSPRPGSPAASIDPSADERIAAARRVRRFDANTLEVEVALPPGADGGWLSYSDVWDPRWTATVNGKPATVERAFLAYKAVALEPGANVVCFKFRAPVRVWTFRVVAVASLLCVLALGIPIRRAIS